MSKSLVLAAGIAPLVGGAESLARNLTLGLIRRGDCVTLISGSPPSDSVHDAVVASGGDHVDIRRGSPSPGLEWEHDCFYRAEILFRYAHDWAPDQVFALSHDAAISSQIALNHMPGVEVIGCFSELATNKDPFGILRSEYAYSLRRTDRYLALSRKYADMAVEYGMDPKRISINPIGVDTTHFSSGNADKGRAILHATGELPIIICPSRFSPRKGQADLLAAMNDNLWPQGCELHFTGSTNYLDTGFLNSLRMSAGDRAVFHENISIEEMPDVLAAATLSVQPSHYEGLGFSALEAMAAGTPAVLTDVEGFDEFACDQSNALVVPARDGQGLAKACRRLLDDADLRQTVINGGHQLVAEHFDLDACIARL